MRTSELMQEQFEAEESSLLVFMCPASGAVPIAS